jgi:hypothetical protein
MRFPQGLCRFAWSGKISSTFWMPRLLLKPLLPCCATSLKQRQNSAELKLDWGKTQLAILMVGQTKVAQKRSRRDLPSCTCDRRPHSLRVQGRTCDRRPHSLRVQGRTCDRWPHSLRVQGRTCDRWPHSLRVQGRTCDRWPHSLRVQGRTRTAVPPRRRSRSPTLRETPAAACEQIEFKQGFQSGFNRVV